MFGHVWIEEHYVSILHRLRWHVVADWRYGNATSPRKGNYRSGLWITSPFFKLSLINLSYEALTPFPTVLYYSL